MTIAVFVCAVALVLGGCGGGSAGSSSATPCGDAAFRGQDEELYVVKATVANAIGGSGNARALLEDLRRGRAALSEYLAAHPPCSETLKSIASGEQEAVGAIDEAITSLDRGNDAGSLLDAALEKLTAAQGALASGS